MSHKEEHVTEIKCPADKFYRMFKHDILELPVAMPGTYKGVEVLEGDGKSVGTIRLWKMVIGDDPNKVAVFREKLEEVDDENRSITFRILDGELMEGYESFAFKLSVTPTSDGGSLVKWVMEFEKKHEHTPHPQTHVDLVALEYSDKESTMDVVYNTSEASSYPGHQFQKNALVFGFNS